MSELTQAEATALADEISASPHRLRMDGVPTPPPTETEELTQEQATELAEKIVGRGQ